MLFRSKDKKMCCLGFYARSQGLGIDAIKGKGTPTELSERNREKVVELLDEAKFDNEVTCNLVDLNDAPEDQLEGDREELIKKEFKRIGVTVEFVK
jgi:hypothetical protein